MKKRIVGVCLLVCTFFALTAFALQDFEQHRSCVHCGMDRKAYGYSRALVIYEDGGQAGLCGVQCAISEIDGHKEKKVASLLVADRDTRQLIDAQSAVWVLGGKKRGIMTDRPKWAFATAVAAQAFVKANGGMVVNWEKALAAVREDTGK